MCPVKCREVLGTKVTVKKKRVETFRNIRYGDGAGAPIKSLFPTEHVSQRYSTFFGETESLHFRNFFGLHRRFVDMLLSSRTCSRLLAVVKA